MSRPVASLRVASQAFVTSSVAAVTAGTIRVVAPYADWKPFTSTDPLTYTYFSGQLQLSRAAGSNFLSIHPSVPTAQYGKAIRFLGVELCNNAVTNTSLSYVELNTANRGLGRTLRLSDATSRTGKECRTYTLSTPYTLTTGDSPVTAPA